MWTPPPEKIPATPMVKIELGMSAVCPYHMAILLAVGLSHFYCVPTYVTQRSNRMCFIDQHLGGGGLMIQFQLQSSSHWEVDRIEDQPIQLEVFRFSKLKHLWAQAMCEIFNVTFRWRCAKNIWSGIHSILDCGRIQLRGNGRWNILFCCKAAPLQKMFWNSKLWRLTVIC